MSGFFLLEIVRILFVPYSVDFLGNCFFKPLCKMLFTFLFEDKNATLKN
jgi:hypothetical protein